MNGLHFMLFAGFLINLCYFNVKEGFLIVNVGLNPSRCHCLYKRIYYLCIVKQKGKKIVNKTRIFKHEEYE